MRAFVDALRHLRRDMWGDVQRAHSVAPHIPMCKALCVATNLAIDDKLIEEARRIGGESTKKAAVTQALIEYIQRRKQARVVELFGEIDIDPGYSHKRQRQRK